MDPNFDFDKSLEQVKRTRKGQRNWDHSKKLPRQAVEHLVQVAVNAPAKQDEPFFHLYVVTNRDLIHELYYEHSWGFQMGYDKNYRNPQVDAHALFVYARAYDPSTYRNHWMNGQPKLTQPFSRVWTNCLTAIGISSGYVSLIASQMGLTVGYNKNFFFQPQSYKRWAEILGHKEPCHPDADPNSYEWGMSWPQWKDPYSGNDSTIVHSIGIGYPDESLKWYQNRDTQYISSQPDDNIDEDGADCLNKPGIVHEIETPNGYIEYSTHSHDPVTGKSIDRDHIVKWIE